jgi:hypothetical protein
MNSELTVGIPTVTRYDLLQKSIARLALGTRRPDRIILIDNGGRFENLFESQIPIELVRPTYNLGVAASWNEILRRADGDVVILNDDVFVGPQTVERMWSTTGLLVSPIVGREFSCFLQRRELWEKLGPYDEGFWPAYHEDADYAWRMKLRGISCEIIPSDGVDHVIGATGQTYEPSKRYVPLVLKRYAHKWGGPYQREVFNEPWNGCAESWNDLEESYRFLAEIQTAIEGKSPMKAVRQLASGCRHITELGCGSGFSTTALLAAQPETLLAINSSRHPLLENVFRLAHLYTKTEFIFREADALIVELEPTDLLVIGSGFDGARLRAHLEKHAMMARRRIVICNTSRDDPDGIAAPGVRVEPIDAFLASHSEWEIHPDQGRDGAPRLLQRRE